MKIAVIGATGLVGTEMLKVLEEQEIPLTKLIAAASERSVGKKLHFKGEELEVVSIGNALNEQPDIAIFSAGSGPSLEWAPRFAEKGTFVVDNSSAWRMDKDKCLVVPEVNGQVLEAKDKIIANPNCSTIQMVMVLAPLHQQIGIKRLVISTYQSYTGTGSNAVRQYNQEREGEILDYSTTAYHHPIFANCIPHCGDFNEDNYTTEEVKLVKETRKILGDDQIQVTATAVRVPVSGGHSESVNIEFKRSFELKDVYKLLEDMPGVVVLDDPMKNKYPMPLMARHKDEVYVGRIRRDQSIENGLNLWIVSDNLRKGAATNAVQIAKYIHEKELVTN